MNLLKTLLENPHRIYKDNVSLWDFYLQSYEGGKDYTNATLTKDTSTERGLLSWLGIKVFAGGQEVTQTISGNLFKHPKEDLKDYRDRLMQSYYYNFCAPIIDIYTEHLFKEPIIEDWEDIKVSVENRINNVDRQDSSLLEFRKNISELSQCYGHIFVVCDTPQIQAVRSLGEKIDTGAFPYFSIFHPQNVVNWALDEYGSPYWVLLRERRESNIDVFNFDVKNVDTCIYYLLTRDEWIIYDSDGKEINRVTHGLGMVPITCFFDRRSKKERNFLGISVLSDIAFISRDVYNSCSELKQILRDQTFAFLALQGDANEYDKISVGTHKGLLYPEGRNPPAYISPASSNAEVYFNHIDRQITKIFQMAKLQPGSAEFEGQTAVQQSGVAKAWDFNQTNSALAKKAGNMEDGEMKLWRIFAAYEGKKEFKGLVSYPKEFSVKSLLDDLDEAERLIKMQISESFDFEIKKAIIKKKFPRMQEKDIKQMYDEIKTSKPEEQSTGIINRLGLFKKDVTPTGTAGKGN